MYRGSAHNWSCSLYWWQFIMIHTEVCLHVCTFLYTSIHKRTYSLRNQRLRVPSTTSASSILDASGMEKGILDRTQTHEDHFRIHVAPKSELSPKLFRYSIPYLSVAWTRTQTRDRRRTEGGICVSTADTSSTHIVRKACSYAAHTTRNGH